MDLRHFCIASSYHYNHTERSASLEFEHPFHYFRSLFGKPRVLPCVHIPSICRIHIQVLGVFIITLAYTFFHLVYFYEKTLRNWLPCVILPYPPCLIRHIIRPHFDFHFVTFLRALVPYRSRCAYIAIYGEPPLYSYPNSNQSLSYRRPPTT